MTDIARAQKLFTRLSSGDTAGYNEAESMARDIRGDLSKAGIDTAALDPAGKKQLRRWMRL